MSMRNSAAKLEVSSSKITISFIQKIAAALATIPARIVRSSRICAFYMMLPGSARLTVYFIPHDWGIEIAVGFDVAVVGAEVLT